jgi:hypothetical protein
MSQSPEVEYSHLSADVAELLATASVEERLRFISRDRFINHRRAEEILNDLETVFRSEKAVRPAGRMLIGRPLMGKSTIIDEFVRNHRASDDPDAESVICPVISVQYPDKGSHGIYPEILRALNVKASALKSVTEMRARCYELLDMVHCQMIIIDEFHNINAGTQNQRAEGINGIKFLMNDLRRPVVVAGTESCAAAVREDEQFQMRLYPLKLDPFKNDDDFSELLAGFELLIPLKKPSYLYEPALQDIIYRLTLGFTGHVSDLLNKAASIAIQQEAEMITPEIIEAVGWGPSLRMTGT